MKVVQVGRLDANCETNRNEALRDGSVIWSVNSFKIRKIDYIHLIIAMQ